MDNKKMVQTTNQNSAGTRRHLRTRNGEEETHLRTRNGEEETRDRRGMRSVLSAMFHGLKNPKTPWKEAY
jgi:hypothetical protein